MKGREPKLEKKINDGMKLGALAEARQLKKDCAFPISEKELCDRYEQVTTPMVNDVLREMQYLYQTLPNNILPLREEMKVCGIAFTIKGSKNLSLENEMVERAAMLESIPKDSICVWDTSEDDESAQWGEIMTMASVRQGCRGAIVDGGVRDTNKVLEQNFPVFCKYRTSNGMLGRFRLIGYQIPIMMGKVMVYPGDVVMGDIDGCIVVPRELAYEVLLRAEEIRDNELEIKNMVNSGMKPSTVVENGGYF